MATLTDGTDTSKRIVVRIQIDSNMPTEFLRWQKWVSEKLVAAGIPLIHGNLEEGTEHGTLWRYDDPAEWGVTVWQWEP